MVITFTPFPPPQHIPWALRRSDIESYKLRYTAEKEGRVSGNIITKYPNTSELLSVDNDIDYTLHLYAVTSENKLSRRHSSLRLVAKANSQSLAALDSALRAAYSAFPGDG